MDEIQPMIVGVQMTPKMLQNIMVGLHEDKAEIYAPLMQDSMNEFDISSPRRVAAFCAQVGHESCSLRFFEEEASGHAYEGRIDLGNTSPGDGVRYKGRGPIQVTGKKNYAKYGARLNVDLISNPELAATPKIGFRIAGAYWFDHGLNALADVPGLLSFKQITYKVNGGYNGEESREEYWSRALHEVGII